MAFTRLSQLLKQTVVESDSTNRYSDSTDFTEEFYSILDEAKKLETKLKSTKILDWMKSTDDLYGTDTIDDLHASQTAVEELVSSLENIDRAMRDAE